MTCFSSILRFLAVLTLTGVSLHAADVKPVKIVLVGDSTVCDYPEKLATRGWGRYLQEALKPECTVVNLAKGGRSTKTFRKEGLWDRTLAERPSWIFIQMGHNDSHGAGRPEATDAATDYAENLRQFVREAREIEAHVVLVTPMVRRTFNEDGTTLDPLAAYADAMKSVAIEMTVPLIDLHASSLQVLLKQGDAGSWSYAASKTDRTHFNETGARAMAQLVVQELPLAAPDLVSYLAAPVPIDVYLIGGQSNATGQGYLANLAPEIRPDPRVLLFHSGKPHLKSGAEPLKWMPLRQASESPDRFGPELGFGNRLQELLPDPKTALIKHAHSGTDLHTQWAPGAPGGPQYQAFVATVDAGLEGLRDLGYAPKLRGMIWQQGEADSKDQTTAAAYGANLAAFIRSVRERFAAPDLRFVYGHVLPPPNAGANRDLVRAGQSAVDESSGDALAVSGAVLVKTDDLDHRATDPKTRYPKDHVHFGTSGTWELGRRFAEAMVPTPK
ncbi:MAG: hypothetical protein KDK97_03745 [Verrucomicrobiales bacterium]|nr:hypothetical protein [Verrucomicrobiales bacterium]MCP5558938.1 hypothetical protein [Verrucomicrobiaceae bacterium]